MGVLGEPPGFGAGSADLVANLPLKRSMSKNSWMDNYCTVNICNMTKIKDQNQRSVLRFPNFQEF